MRKLAFALFVLLACAASAQASTITYQAFLSGPNEAPPNGSPATGYALVTVDNVLNTMLVEVTFSGLVAPNTASHIHCCTTVPFVSTAGVATSTPTFIGFPTGTTSGSYTHLFNLLDPTSYNPAFISAHTDIPTAEAFLLGGMALGESYLNIHSQTFGGGEIRGFLVPVPEPATLTLMALGVLTVAVRRRRRI